MKNQPRAYYTLSDIKMTLENLYPKMPTLQTRLIAAVKDLAKTLFEKEWKREDGHTLHLNVGGIDANWETETIKKAVRVS